LNYQNASIFIIGTELTRGIIGDKHGQLIATELSHLGYHVDRMVIVPDDGTIGSVLRDGIATSDVVIITGGLGPTSDDLTRKVVADLAGVPLVRDQASFDYLYKNIGERIWGSNEVQAMFPTGFVPIPNPYGTAPGFRGYIQKDARLVACIAMPGPPREMDPMFFNEVLPLLASLRGHNDFERDEYSSYLVAEAKLEELCHQVDIGTVQWGTRFQNLRISLYLTGERGARRQFAQRLSQFMGPSLLEEGDHEAVDLLTDELVKQKLTISCAESCTAGLASKLLTDKAGSSSWFWGGVSTYANEAKSKILGVNQAILDGVGPVSRECAIAMADGIQTVSGTDVAFSITGFAGPEGSEVGEVWLGFCAKDRQKQAVKLKFSSWGRDSVRRKACVAAFILCRQYLAGCQLLDMCEQWQYI